MINYLKIKCSFVDPNRKLETFQSEFCLGQRIVLKCKDPENVIRIDSAFVGRHSTDTDYCVRKILACPRNVTGDFRAQCTGRQNCDFGFSSKYTSDGCGVVKYLALDINYTCGKFSVQCFFTALIANCSTELCVHACPEGTTIKKKEASV